MKELIGAVFGCLIASNVWLWINLMWWSDFFLKKCLELQLLCFPELFFVLPSFPCLTFLLHEMEG